MLDQLASLDDATPPEPDAAMLARVRGRANRRLRRNRFAVAAAGVGSLVVVVGAVAVMRDRGPKAYFTGPSTSTTTLAPTPKPVSEGTLPNGLHIRMTLETPMVVLGNQIHALIEVRNQTGKPQGIGTGSLQCSAYVGPVLRDSRGVVVADAIHDVACYLPLRAITAGQTITFTMTLSSNSVVIPRGQHRRRFELGLEPVASRSLVIWKLAPLAVDVVAPRVTGRIELSKLTFGSGDVVNGTLVLDNIGDAPVHYTVRCGAKPWEVLLADHGVALPIPMAQPGCSSTPATLPRGSSRMPFSVPLRYSSCGHPGIPLAGIPDCVEGAIPPGTYPPLPAGTYQIVFNGRGAFGSVEVAPVPIQVVAAPK